MVDTLKHWFNVKTVDTTKHEDLNLVFANHGKEDEIYPLTIIEIAEAQRKMLKHQKRECIFNLLKTPKCLVRKINNHSSISTAQGC
jgi:hypothetical protein